MSIRVGTLVVHPITDGTFVASPGYFHPQGQAADHPELFATHGKAWLPIGCFVLDHGDRTVLIDAGMGPNAMVSGERCQLYGGQLLVGLNALDLSPAHITDVIVTHLHTDHVGWLFDAHAQPVFKNAEIWFGLDDWDHFLVTPNTRMYPDHLREGFLAEQARETNHFRPLDTETAITPQVHFRPTPGHTPGHGSVLIASGTDRLIVLGDAITCPVQLDEPTWHSIGDVDPDLADRTRQALWRELEDPSAIGVGAHFPGLQHGRVLTATGARKWTAGPPTPPPLQGSQI